MLAEVARGMGIQAYGDPMPGPGVSASMSYSPPNGNRGWIQLVGSMGKLRSATYRDVYLFNPFVYAATNFIARGVGRLPQHVYQLTASGEKIRLRSDLPQPPGRPAAGVQLDRILNVPSDGVSRMAATAGKVREWLIYGNALDEIVQDGAGGLPTDLRPVSWMNIDHVEEDGYGHAVYYEISENGKPATRRRVSPDQVVHYGYQSESGRACGVSILESCKHTLALHEALMRHLNSYFENSARGSGYFKVDNEAQAKKAREMITALYTSPENAGKVLITSAEWKSMADSPDHAAIVDLIKESRVEVAAAFQVPPPVLGLLEQAIRANVKEMREQFNRDTIGPWTAAYEGEVEAQLINRFQAWSGLQMRFELAEQLRPDLEARALVYQRLMFVMAIDEIRAMEGLPPLKIAGVTDVPWVQSGALPLTTAAQSRSRSSNQLPSDDGGDVVGLDLAREILALTERFDANGNGNHLSEVP